MLHGAAVDRSCDYLERERPSVSFTNVSLGFLVPYQDQLLTDAMPFSSKAHFRQALSSAALTTSAANDHPAPSSVSDFPSSGSLKTKKLHSCPHPDCSNRYKQVSGLRYHLAHVRVYIILASLLLDLAS